MNQEKQQLSLSYENLDYIFKEGVVSIQVKQDESYSLYRQDYQSLLGQNWLRTQALDLLLKLQFNKYSSEIRKTFAGRAVLDEKQHSQYIKMVDAFVATLIMTNSDKVILQSLAPLQLFSKNTKYLIVPINTDLQKGQHWLLALYQNGNYLSSNSHSCLYVFDSGWGATHIGHMIKKQLQFFYQTVNGESIDINICFGEVPKQSNSYDCGIYTVGFAEYALNEILEQLQQSKPLQINRLSGKYKYLLANPKLARQRYRQLLQSKLKLYLS